MDDPPQRTRVGDVEKAALSPQTEPTAATDGSEDSSPSPSKLRGYWKGFEKQLIRYNFEERGITRVEPHERHDLRSLGYLQVATFWFSINLAANNITLGMLGPAVFHLSFLDASLTAVLGMLLGCVPVAYIATFGPRSGNRTMIFARYAMGWHPSKLVVLLNIVVLLGYSLLDCVVAGQILSAVSPDGALSIAVGIVVVALITWAITTFGYQVFHYYERYAWAPQLVVLSILAGVAGPSFDLTTPTAGDARTRTANRLSFLSLCLAAAITYSGGAADYFVYYPAHTPRRALAALTLLGLSLSFTFAFTLGIGLASALPSNAPWATAYSTSQGALIVRAYTPLGAFGSFCAVVVALGLVANLIVPTYSAGIDFQILGRRWARVPRAAWNTAGVVVYTVCALAGRDHLAEIFTNFLALMGYWVSIWVAITLEEHVLFRRAGRVGMGRGGGRADGVGESEEVNDGGYVWSAWNQREKLPHGIAALCAFVVGWIGAILCMAQVWYVGPIARLVGEYGADMGNYVGFAWAALVFPPLRWLELKKFNR